MPKKDYLKKILVIGSGPIIIGQAAEFDYAGTQACLSLKEEGYQVVLVNSNPATIMTDKEIADVVYIEPLNKEYITKIIKKEKPDAILPTLGGQIALNLTVELSESGILDEYNIEVLGTKLDSIKLAEDRYLFRKLMNDINEPVPESEIVNTVEDAISFANTIGYPVIVRPAYTMGGTGGGMCNNQEELQEIVTIGLNASPIKQCLIEKSIYGWKEIEYEVMRDASDNSIVITNMENIDPVGVHTGDSMVVAPCQSLTEKENDKLRNISLKIIKALKIEGGCNVQIALDPNSEDYYIIEVNPRVSRSSALASKATGYPIARIASKIAIGLNLNEILNPVTKKTFANVEPAIDYVVLKIARFPFDKFTEADPVLGTQMKATGEVMGIGRNFEESFLKAIRSLESKQNYFYELNKEVDLETLKKMIHTPTDERLSYIAHAIRNELLTLQEIYDLCKIDLFFIKTIKNILDLEKQLVNNHKDLYSYIEYSKANKDLNELKNNLKDYQVFVDLKAKGFGDAIIAKILNIDESYISGFRKFLNLKPVYKMVDTCAGQFESSTPYYYSTYDYDFENESIQSNKQKIIVLGSGPIRIGQGIEFDYATVHAILALKKLGYEAIVINNNPETVSTDSSISDKLYFEPLTKEDVLNIIELEKPIGVLVQFGGQTAINLATKLAAENVNILGTSLESIAISENRDKFEKFLATLNIPQPPGKAVLSVADALNQADKIGYPVLVRPSFVLGGRAMQIVYNANQLQKYVENALTIDPTLPVLIDKYFLGKELEVDAICDQENVYIAGIMEHLERAGIHSGDSIAIYPTVSLSQSVIDTVTKYTNEIALALKVQGLINIQFVLFENKVYVLEVNLRSSRTVPFLSKVKNISFPNLATKAMLNIPLNIREIESQIKDFNDLIAVKVPVYSFNKLKDVDITLGPEMKSTGEVMGVGPTLSKALYKGFTAANWNFKNNRTILIDVVENDYPQALEIAKGYYKSGFKVYVTKEVNQYFKDNGFNNAIEATINSKNDPNKLIDENRLGIFLSTIKSDNENNKLQLTLRQHTTDKRIITFTCVDTCKALLKVIWESSNLVYSL